MKKVFIFWDNSNIFISGRMLAKELEGPDAYYQFRLQFDNIYELARAGREVDYALAVGSVPPELRQICYQMEKCDITVELQERGSILDPKNETTC